VRLLRALSFLILAFLASGLTFLVASVGMLLDPGRGRVGHAMGRMWGRLIIAAAGARLVVVGAEKFAPGEPRVLACNHASYLDIPAMFAAFPGQARFVARRTLDWMPFVGWYIRLGGHFSIDRDDPRQALRLMEKTAARMKRYGLSPVLFPEGTRSRDGRLAPLKTGALQFALAAGVPVQPIAILGSAEALPKGAWAPRYGKTIEVRVGDAIPTAGLVGSAGRRALAEQTRAGLLAVGVPDGEAGGMSS
jgi:1-acyl-sn-glycerol-3-phosphate acyltransferase